MIYCKKNYRFKNYFESLFVPLGTLNKLFQTSNPKFKTKSYLLGTFVKFFLILCSLNSYSRTTFLSDNFASPMLIVAEDSKIRSYETSSLFGKENFVQNYSDSFKYTNYSKFKNFTKNN